MADPSMWFPFDSSAPEAKVRLFCLPHAGGVASSYQRWLSQLSPTIDVRPTEFPGHGTRLVEPLIMDADSLVKEFTLAVLPLLDRTYALFGHSLGAVMAFETIRELRLRGAPLPKCLFVSGSAAPGNRPICTPFSQLSDAEFIERLKRFHLFPPAVYDNGELMKLALPSIRADVEIGEKYTYRVERSLSCPIVALAASNDSAVTIEQVREWGTHTDSAFRLHIFPGDHFFISTSEATVLELVSSILAESN